MFRSPSMSDSLAELFQECIATEKRRLPDLEQTQAEKDHDLDLYRRLLKIDKLKSGE